jgi:hypothetical protein
MQRSRIDCVGSRDNWQRVVTAPELCSGRCADPCSPDLVTRAARRLCPGLRFRLQFPTNARQVGRGVACIMRGPESFIRAAGSVITRSARTCQSEAPTNGADMTSQFRSGQTVRLSRGPPYKSAADGDYKIVRQLPDNGGEQQYRIKSVREPHERVVKESDLEKV